MVHKYMSRNKWVMSHLPIVMSHTWTSHVTYMNILYILINHMSMGPGAQITYRMSHVTYK